VSLCWSLVLNQSAAEQSDLVACLWLPVLVLGWSLFFGRLFRLLICHRDGGRTAAYIGVLAQFDFYSLASFSNSSGLSQVSADEG